MGTLTMSRRSFVKAAAVTGGVAALAAASTPWQALAQTDYHTPPDEGGVQRIRSCCRGCGKMECGVFVTVKDGRAIKIDGDPSAPHSMGNCCTKSVSSMQAAYHPDRLKYPMKRTNPKGEEPGWERISWDEALKTVYENIEQVRAQYGGESLFTMGGTGRIWCMSPYAGYGPWFMTPNTAVAWQVCKGPRHFASALTSEYNHSWSASVDRPPVFTVWASTPEVSNYDESGRSVVDEVFSADTVISVDPRKTALGKEADHHINLKPGTDAAVALSMCQVVIAKDLIDDAYIKRWTNGPFLVCDTKEASGPEIPHIYHGPNFIKSSLLSQADLTEDGDPYKYMVWDSASDSLKWFCANPEETGWEGEKTWEPYDGRPSSERFPGQWGEANVRDGVSQCWLPDATTFEAIDPALYGEFEVTLKDGTTAKVRPVFDHFAEYCEEFEPTKAQAVTGVSPDVITESATVYGTRKDPRWGNGGILYQLGVEHATNSIMNCRAIEILTAITGNTDGPGGQRGSTKIDVNYMGNFADASYSTEIDSPLMHPEIMEKQLGRDEHPLFEWWGLWANATDMWKAGVTGDPYPLKAAVCQSGDFLNMGNTEMAWETLSQLDFFFDIDMWHHPTSELADIILPAQHWLEVGTPRQSQGSGGALGACVPCIEPQAETRYDPWIVEELYRLADIPWGWDPENPYPTISEIQDHVVRKVSPSWNQFCEEFQENGWWDVKLLEPDDWGTYRRYETGFMRKDYTMDAGPENVIPGFNTPTMKQEIWSTVMETYHDEWHALPRFMEPQLSQENEPELWQEYPVMCITGRRIPVYFHSEHRQLPWCREQWLVPRVEVNPADASQWGVEQGDWVWIESPHGKIRQCVDLYYGIPQGTINCEHQWWFPECDAPEHGWRYSAVNQLVNNDVDDPHCGSSNVRCYPVKVYKAPEGAPEDIISTADDDRLKAWLPEDGVGNASVALVGGGE